MAMQSNGVGPVLASESPSTHGYYLVNPNDASQAVNNIDVVPPGTGPSNVANGGTVDPYWLQLY